MDVMLLERTVEVAKEVGVLLWIQHHWKDRSELKIPLI